MRIGILTFHAAHNYGAVLQCFALQEYLRSRGADVEIIDYRNKKMLDIYKPLCFKLCRRKNVLFTLEKLFNMLIGYREKRKRYENFEKFINHFINFVPVSTINVKPYDVIIVGSDQVWNVKLTFGYDRYYWGLFQRPSQTKLVSYAASMIDVNELENEQYAMDLLKSFDRISVREPNIMAYLKKKNPKLSVQTVVDPTMLLDKEKWNEIAVKPPFNEEYILLYQVNPSPEAEKLAQKVSAKTGIKVVNLSSEFSRKNTRLCRCSGPAEFVGLFKYASFVVAASFHGTVFSLLFNKPFLSVKMNNKRDMRPMSLLESLDMLDHFVSYDEDFNLECLSEMDEGKFENITMSSKSFISDILTM